MLTGDQLTDHRLKALEEYVPGILQAQRDVDLLKAAVARFEAGLEGSRAEAAAHNQQLQGSLSRLHTRLEQLSTDEAREQGAKAERGRMFRWVFAAVTVASGLAGAIAAVLAVALGS